MRDAESDRRPILVTGAFRSGTTWVGKCLASAPGVAYIFEPSNPDVRRPGRCGARWPRPFTYVTGENEEPYLPWLQRTAEFRYNLLRELGTVRTPGHLWRALRESVLFSRWRRRGAIPLFKDPLAVFSAEWMAERLAMRPVCTIRHPAGFVSSMKRLHWWFFDFRIFTEQPLLMRDHASEFEPEIRKCAEKHPGNFEAGILLYRVFYAAVDKYRRRHPEWTFVRQEDLARDPNAGFAAVFARLGLDFAGATREWIAANCAESNPSEPPLKRIALTRLNSRAAAESWRHRLTAEEVAMVKESTADVWPRFYGEEDW